jgi:hypothetical protein
MKKSNDTNGNRSRDFPVAEMNTRNNFWAVKKAGAYG